MTMIQILAPSSAPMMHMASVPAGELRLDDIVSFSGAWFAVAYVYLYLEEGGPVANVLVSPIDEPLATRRWQIAAGDPVAALRAEGAVR